MQEWEKLSTLIENTRLVGNLNARNLATFGDRIDDFLRRWSAQAASGEEGLWKVLEQAGPSLKAKLQLGRDLAQQQDQAARARQLRLAEIESRIEQAQRETAAIYQQTADAQKRAWDERNQAWMRVNFPQRYCPYCQREFLLPHHYCSHCHCGTHGFNRGF